MVSTRHTRTVTLLVLIALAGLAAPATAGDAASPSLLERFKALEGEWVAAEDGPMTKKGELVARYRVTAAGSAVVETEFPGTPHEMVTVYYAEGDDVVLQHYCMLGNQPRMRTSAVKGNRVEFAFDGGRNLEPQHDRHIHSGWVEFVGPNEMRGEWIEHDEGEPISVVRVHQVRKADREAGRR